MVRHACNFNNQEAKAGVQGQPRSYKETLSQKKLDKTKVNKIFLCFSQELYFIYCQLRRLTSSSCCVFQFMNVVCFPIYFGLFCFLYISILSFLVYKSHASFIRFISCNCAKFLFFQFQEVFYFVFIVFGIFYIDKIFWIICIIIQS